MDLPTHCLCCGVYLQGGATVHRADCLLSDLATLLGLPPALLLEFDVRPLHGRSPIDTLRERQQECHCRTCGHPASSHIYGACFECGREACWS